MTFQEYPKMLSRPGKGEGQMIWGERIDTHVVENITDEQACRRQGWLDAVPAHELVKKWRERQAKLVPWKDHWLKNWQFYIGTAVAAFIAYLWH